jgi:sulfur dioxygenase
MIFRQLFDKESSTYTYLLADKETKEGVLIDPVFEQVERDCALIGDLSVKLKFILETHVHADHITGADAIRNITGAKIAMIKHAQVQGSDKVFEEGDELSFGNHLIKVLYTPGHTNTCCCFFVNGMIFTGDSLMIRGTGRTDFQSGSPETLYDSIHQKIFSLPDSTLVYPAHNYQGKTVSTIIEEKKFNPRINLGKTKEEFIEIMNNLNLSYPKKIDLAVPANQKCGKQ